MFHTNSTNKQNFTNTFTATKDGTYIFIGQSKEPRNSSFGVKSQSEQTTIIVTKNDNQVYRYSDYDNPINRVETNIGYTGADQVYYCYYDIYGIVKDIKEGDVIKITYKNGFNDTGCSYYSLGYMLSACMLYS